jgi:histidine ammonia-lyase
MSIHLISDNPLNLRDLHAIYHHEKTLVLSPTSREKIELCRQYLDQTITKTREPIYGINTGFGSLYNHHISLDQLEQLQENLVKSHACGMGATVPSDIVKLMLFLKVQSLSYGHSGVQLKTVERLIEMFNHNILPIVYEMGSLGASGDLAP